MNTDFETADAPRARRLRRAAAVLAAAALATAGLPLSQASAAPTAAAALTAAGQKVFPGSGEPLTVNVTNNGTRVFGETVNWVQVKLPNTAGFTSTTGAITAPSGWTATRDAVIGGLATYTFRGGALEPGATGAFTFPTLVAAPVADRTGVLEVAVSSDNGRTTSGAGSATTLSSLVQTLQVVADSFKATAPAGVTDGIATAGQDVDYAFSVRNLAKASQTVASTLSSPDSSDKITQAAPASIAAGAVGVFTSDVLLGGAGSRIFNASAKAGPSVADALGGPAFTVLGGVGLDVGPTLSPMASRGDVTLPLTIDVSKTGAQTVVTAAKLELKRDGGAALATKDISGVSLPAGAVSQKVVFPSVVLGSMASPLANGVYDATVTFTGRDDNGAPVSYSETLVDVLTIDNDLPDIIRLDLTLPNDADGVRQTAVSNSNDTVTIAGELAAADCAASIQSIEVKAGAKTFGVTPSKSGCTFTGSFTTGRDITFDNGTTGFSVTARAVDAAGNGGSEVTTGLVDITAPVIASATTKAATADSSAARRIEVQFFDTVPVLGGCTASQWEVDGELLISTVQFSNGDPCSDTEARADNIRVLVLNADRDQGLQTNVTYTPGTRPFARPAKDGAGQDALEQLIATTSGVNPAAALLRTVTRNNAPGATPETATLDGSYFTRFPGDDLVVSFLNGRVNYLVDVLDGQGQILRTTTLGNPAADGTHSVRVPVGTTDGSVARALRLRIAKGDTSKVDDDLRSALTSFTVVLDRLEPKLQTVVKTGDRQATATFTETLTSGTDFAEDWFVKEQNNQHDPEDPNDDVAYYQVGSVSGSGATRVLNTNSALGGLGALGAAYNIRNPGSARYVDRAGNPVADTGA